MPDVHLTPPDVRFATIERYIGYRFGDDGSVWTCLQRHGRRGGGTFTDPTGPWRRLRPILYRGYFKVSPVDRTRPRQQALAVHRLILEAFRGPRPERMVCRHLNGNPRDNRLENLCWGSCRENEADKLRHGTRAWGARCGRSTLTEAQVSAIRAAVGSGRTQRSVAAEFGISQGTVGFIWRRETWKHV
jgi:hypothetical protein